MILHKGTKTLETKELLLRPFRRGDEEAIFTGWASDPMVTQFLRWTPHAGIHVTRSILDGWVKGYQRPDQYLWGITLRENGRLIGSIGAHTVSEYDASCEVGYCLAREYWSKGYMSQALRAVIQYLLCDVGYNRVEAYHSVNNPASGRVMEKSGMRREGVATEKYRCSLGFQDSVLYGITRSQWDALYV